MKLFKHLAITLAAVLIAACGDGGGGISEVAVKSDVTIARADVKASNAQVGISAVDAKASNAQISTTAVDAKPSNAQVSTTAVDAKPSNTQVSIAGVVANASSAASLLPNTYTYTVKGNTPVALTCRLLCKFAVTATGASVSSSSLTKTAWKAILQGTGVTGQVTVVVTMATQPAVTIVFNVNPAFAVAVTGGTMSADGSYAVINNGLVTATCNTACAFTPYVFNATLSTPVITATSWTAKLTVIDDTKVSVLKLNATTPFINNYYQVLADPVTNLHVVASSSGQVTVGTTLNIGTPTVVSPLSVSLTGGIANASSYTVPNGGLATVACNMPCTFNIVMANTTLSNQAANISTWSANPGRTSSLTGPYTVTVTVSAAGQPSVVTVIDVLPSVIVPTALSMSAVGVSAVKNADGTYSTRDGNSVDITCSVPCTFTPSANNSTYYIVSLTPTHWIASINRLYVYNAAQTLQPSSLTITATAPGEANAVIIFNVLSFY
jgi:hypothetical protein